MSLTRDMDYVAELTTREAVALTLRDDNNDSVLDRMEAMKAGHPRAASWDNGPRSDKAYCRNHDQDVKKCHSDCMPCVGESHYVGHSDPTGDAAMDTDVAAIDLDNLRRAVKRLKDAAELVENIISSYPGRRKANAYERQQTADENAPRCESCHRIEIAKGVPWWVEPLTQERSTVSGRLSAPMWLDRFCYDHVVKTGIIPSEAEVEQHRAGKRIHCPHPKIEKEDAA